MVEVGQMVVYHSTDGDWPAVVMVVRNELCELHVRAIHGAFTILAAEEGTATEQWSRLE